MGEDKNVQIGPLTAQISYLNHGVVDSLPWLSIALTQSADFWRFGPPPELAYSMTANPVVFYSGCMYSGNLDFGPN